MSPSQQRGRRGRGRGGAGFIPPACVTVVCAAAVSAAVCAAVEVVQRRRDLRLRPPRGELVAVGRGRGRGRAGGGRLHVEAWRGAEGAGAGGATVLLESGANSWSAHWGPLLAELRAAGLGYVAYDRPGLGHSDECAGAGGPPAAVQALEALGVGGPLLIVAHSLGALLLERYLPLLRPRVIGLVFVDGATAEGVRMLAPGVPKAVPPGWLAGAAGGVGLLRAVSPALLGAYWAEFGSSLRAEARAVWARGRWLRAYCREWVEMVAFARSLPPEPRGPYLGALPVAVVLPDVPQRRGRAEVAAVQRRLATCSRDARLFEAPACGHFVQLHRPDVVMAAVRHVLARAAAAPRARALGCKKEVR